jgi:Divergent InlB B-repeat domain/PASTA domain
LWSEGTRLRLFLGLLCAGALAVLLASAGWTDGDAGKGAADPDAGQVAPPPPAAQPKTSPNAYFRAEAQASALQGGPSLPWASVGKSPVNGGYGPSGTLPPWSGRGTSIAVSGSVSTDHTAYLGTAEGGVWKTTDDGAHWTAVFDNEPTLAIGAVAVDPTNTDIVYAGTGEANWQLQAGQVLLGDGIYRSTDGGNTWAHSSIPFASGYMGGGCGVESLAVDPAATNIVLAAVFCPGTSSSSATALIRSTDGGATWTPVGPVVGSNEDQAPMLTRDPADPTVWFATISATGGLGGVWKSIDSGATWNLKQPSVPTAEKDTWTAPRGVVAAASNGNRLYALFEGTYACPTSGHGSCLDCSAGACGDTVADPQLWTSTDAGENWTKVTAVDQYGHTTAQVVCGSNTCSSTLSMAVSHTDSSTLYVGSIFFVKVTNYGAQYSYGSAPIHADDHGMEFDSLGRLWVANDGGIYRFDNEGTMDTSVDNLNATLPTIQIYQMSVGQDGKILIATQDQGCDLYDPNTQVWTQWAWGPYVIGCGDSTNAIISAVHPGVMYAGTQFLNWIVRTPPSPASDPSQPWDHLGTTPPCNQFSLCTPFIDPLVEEPGTGALIAGGNSQVYRLANPDTTPGYSTSPWVSISPQFDWYPGAIAVADAHSNTQTIYVGSSAYSNVTSQMGIEVTHNGGATWSLGTGCCGFAPVSDIQIDPNNPSHAYATTSSWPTQAPREGVANNGAVSQVVETTDGGTTWQSVGSGLPAAPYNRLAVDWSFPKHTIYVATDVGVFWSEDDGTIWHGTSSGMPTVSVEDLKIQTVNSIRMLYAATFGRGVYSVAPISTVLQTLVAAKSGSGSGTVTSSPAGLDCGSACAYDFGDGAAVTLTATAAAGSTFTGWSGACSGAGTTCQLSMTSDLSATANFAPNPHLTVSRQGSGSGTVTSSPAGVSCGSTCSSGGFSLGSTVTLTASAAPGSTFTGWSGGCSGTAPTCQLSMTTDRSATATFTANPFLTVSLGGSGSGTVTSSPSGIDCGAACSYAFPVGTTVTLTATAAAGSGFAGWSGDCSGTATCVLPMSSAHSATATFALASPPPPPSVKCTVPRLKGKSLTAAKSALRKAHCALGSVKKAYSSSRKGTVVGQRAKPGSKHASGFKVGVTVSKGRKP